MLHIIWYDINCIIYRSCKHLSVWMWFGLFRQKLVQKCYRQTILLSQKIVAETKRQDDKFFLH